MMEIQSESWKPQVMIIPSTSPITNVVSHHKSSTSHPHSNENQNWITDNDNTISNPPVNLPYHIILSPIITFKCQSRSSPPISEEAQSPVTTLSFSLETSQSNNAYPHSQPFSQITPPSVKNTYTNPVIPVQFTPILLSLDNTHSLNPATNHLSTHSTQSNRIH